MVQTSCRMWLTRVRVTAYDRLDGNRTTAAPWLPLAAANLLKIPALDLQGIDINGPAQTYLSAEAPAPAVRENPGCMKSRVRTRRRRVRSAARIHCRARQARQIGREIEDLLSDEVFHVGLLLNPAIDHDGAEHHLARASRCSNRAYATLQCRRASQGTAMQTALSI